MQGRCKFILEKNSAVGREVNQEARVVKDLVKEIQHFGRNITCDDFFTSIPLARDLLKKNHTLIGTIRKNKPELPPQFTAYVRYIADENIMKELLFCKCSEMDTKGQTIFQTLSDYLQNKSIPFTNRIARATDGAPVMVGRYRGFSSLLKKKKQSVCSALRALPSAFGSKAS